jgi:hypothetical protein
MRDDCAADLIWMWQFIIVKIFVKVAEHVRGRAQGFSAQSVSLQALTLPDHHELCELVPVLDRIGVRLCDG